MSSIEKVDLARTFYFSYSYDLSQTIQYGFTHPIPQHQVRDMFVWNWNMLRPILDSVGIDSPWCIPLIHGFVDQASTLKFFHLLLFLFLYILTYKNFLFTANLLLSL